MEEELNWFDAKDVCVARGAQLVQPNSELKELSIREKFRSINQTIDVWLGATQHPNGDPNEAPGDQYLYTDGTTVGFTNWGPGRHISIYLIQFCHFNNVCFCHL